MEGSDTASTGVAFALTSKKQKKRQVICAEERLEKQQREHIVGMDESGTVSAVPVVKAGPLVIPLPPKRGSVTSLTARFTARTRGMNGSVREMNADDQAAAEALIRELQEPNGSTNGTTLTIPLAEQNTAEQRIPLLLQHVPEELLGEMTEDERFKKDLSLKADDVEFTSDIFEKVPVDQFGAAMLRGMGWTEAETEGENEFKMPVPRHERLGLGATPKPPTVGKAKRPLDKEAAKHWEQRASTHLSSQQLQNGDIVRLLLPQFVDMRARVVRTKGVAGLDQVEVELERSGNLLSVGKTHALRVSEAELSTQPYEEPLQQTKEKRDPVGKDGKGQKRSRDDRGEKEKNKESASKRSNRQSENERPSRAPVPVPVKLEGWLRPRVHVRIVSKSVENGTHYLQKGVIVDVPERNKATVHLQSGNVIYSVKERHLETVLPAVSGKCIVLLGEGVGQRATLMEKIAEDNSVIVQYDESLQVEKLPMDYIAAASDT